MNRRVPLARQPMPPRTVPLRRRKALTHGAASIGVGLGTFTVAGLRDRRYRHVASNTPARREDLTRQQRAHLYARSGGWCEGALTRDCWRRLPEDLWQAAHRNARGQGGDNTALWNRWAACPPCHAWQHDHSDAARESGHYVRSGLDPRRMPMCLPDGRVVILGETGGYAPAVLGGDAA